MTQTVQRVAGFQSSSFRSYGTGLVNLASKAAKLRVKSKNKSKFFIDKKILLSLCYLQCLSFNDLTASCYEEPHRLCCFAFFILRF
jgi:hypothetical protein